MFIGPAGCFSIASAFSRPVQCSGVDNTGERQWSGRNAVAATERRNDLNDGRQADHQ